MSQPPPGPGPQWPGYDQAAYYGQAGYYGQQQPGQPQYAQQPYPQQQQYSQQPAGAQPPVPPPPGQPAAYGQQQVGYGYGQAGAADYSAYYAQQQAAYAQQYPQYAQQQVYAQQQGYGQQAYAQQAYAQPQAQQQAQPPPPQPPPPQQAGYQPPPPQPPPPPGHPAGYAAQPGAYAQQLAQQQHAAAAAPNPHQQQYAFSDSYNAVPPPSSLAPSGAAAGGGARHVFSVRPQVPKAKPPQVVAAFQQAAAGLAAAPAYTRVQVGAPAAAQAQQAQAQAVGPQQWPPALKSYVERAFKIAARERPKLQEILKKVIADAQASGELWTRDWDAMPLPDLTQSAADAAAVLAEVAAVSGPAAQPRPSLWAQAQQKAQQLAAQTKAQQAQQAQQHQYAAQQYAAQQYGGQAGRGRGRGQRQRLQAEDGEPLGRRGRKRGWQSEEEEEEDGQGWSFYERQRRQRRAGRFADEAAKHGGGGGWAADERRARVLALMEEGSDEEIDWDAVAIKGACQALEKSYFRLTSAPDPATVRPEAVLRRALARLLGLLRGRQVNYFYALDQFKGMRQDCTVQHIRNDLTVQVYEGHARAALEYGDVAEYNQCQSQLRALYNEGTPGSRTEFLAYRIIYQAVHARHGEILQLLNTLKKVKPEEAAQPAVAHALRVRAALAAADYRAFFRLYAAAPALGRALMDIYVPTLRYDALTVVVKAFKPSVPLPFLAGLLGFMAPPATAAGEPGAGGAAGAGKSADGERAEPAEGAAAAAGAAEHGAAGGGAAEAAGGGAGPQEPAPGCMELVCPGEHPAQTDAAEACRDCVAWLLECGAVVTAADGIVLPADADVDGLAGPAEASLDCRASVGQLKMPEEKEKVAHGDDNLTVADFLKGFSAVQGE